MKILFFIFTISTICSPTLAQLSLVKNQECGENEAFETCGTACEPSCDTPSPSFCTLQCVVGCQCERGYFRNSDKKCVTSDQCTISGTTVPSNVTCGKNEIFSACHSPCTEKKCPVANPVQTACVLMCFGGCGCAENFVRNTQGECVLESQCPEIETSNSTENPCNTVDCRSGYKCENQNGTAQCVEEVSSSKCALIRCSSGFECDENYGKCLKIELDINSNATISTGCLNITCPDGEYCEEISPKVVSCVPMDASQNSTVLSGCDLVRCNKNEQCVEETVNCFRAPCPIQVSCVSNVTVISGNGTENGTSENDICPNNQTWSTCLNTCSEHKCPGMESSNFCIKVCRQGCACNSGYLRSNDGECYERPDCPLEQICGANEEYKCSNCIETCKKPEPNCGKNRKNCTKSCVCASGFVRKNGKCVTLDSCDDHSHGNITCSGTEEYTDCLPKCRQLCSGSQVCDNSVKITQCQAGCVCRGNYKLDTNGQCVHNRFCFKSTTCPENEEWSKCAANDNFCTGITTKSPKNDQCFSGCICSTGFARNTNGTCVEEKNC